MKDYFKQVSFYQSL